MYWGALANQKTCREGLSGWCHSKGSLEDVKVSNLEKKRYNGTAVCKCLMYETCCIELFCELQRPDPTVSDRDTGEKACFRTPCRMLWSAGQEPGGAASEGRVALTLTASPRVKQVLWAGHPGVPLHRAEALRGLSVHNGGKLQQWTLALRGLIPASCWEVIYAFKRPRLSLASPSTLILTAFPTVLKKCLPHRTHNK